MKVSVNLAAAVFLTLVVAVGGETADIIQLRAFVVDTHNVYRRGEGASDMEEMTWDDQLADEAADWGHRCDFEHQMAGRGENLAFESNMGHTDKEAMANSMKLWFDEKRHFRLGRQRMCDQSCHYTQMVWSNTSRVGCSLEKCGYLRAFGRDIPNALYIVCFYDPAGNIGGIPYRQGRACSRCPKETVCRRELCHRDSVSEGCRDLHNSRYCQRWAEEGECEINAWWMLKNCAKSCRIC